MNIQMIGCSHQHASIEVREQLAFGNEQAEGFLLHLRDRFPASEFLLLSTCNRIELYCGSQDRAKLPEASGLIAELANFHQLPIDRVSRYMEVQVDREAISHLFSVAGSLDSLVFGETQIISQVRKAYDSAKQLDLAGPVIHSAFQQAAYVAKRIANETEIQSRRLSVPSVAVSEIAAEFFERLDDKKVVVIGGGEMSIEALTYLIEHKAQDISILNRTAERAQEIARQFQVQARPWEELDRHVQEADLVISTTSAKEPIYTADHFQKVIQQRERGLMLLLDLALPRDIDPLVGKLPGIYLYSLDDLTKVVDRNAAFRRSQFPKAKRIVEEELNRFFAMADHRQKVPAIRQLREQADLIKQAELERLRNKMGAMGVAPEVANEVEQSFDRLVNKMLHPVLKGLRDESKEANQSSLLDTLRRLFQLKD